MVLLGKQLRSQKSKDLDAAHDLLHSTEISFDEILEYERLLDEPGVDSDYKVYLLESLVEAKNAMSNTKQRDKDEECEHNIYREVEGDPEYEFFFERLKEHDKSYIVEYEENGSRVVLKYEGGSSSGTESDLEPRRKLRSCMEQKDGASSQKARVENQSRLDSQSRRMLRARELKTEHFNLRDEDDSQSTPMKEMRKVTVRSSRNKSKSGKEDDIVHLDLDYHTFSENLKLVNNGYVYVDKVHTVVYEKKNGVSTRVKEEEDNDISYSDVEFLDSTAFYNMNKSSILNQNSEFRHKVITALRKPFDEKEYKKLWQDITIRKAEERHLELRNGRDRSYGRQNYGKAYIDHHPVIKRKLTQVKDDKPKFLNLLRGFFLWLEQPESFCPWLDEECLAIYPEPR